MEKKRYKKTTRGDKTRLKILETAVKMMSEKGPDAVSMREIASYLKITKPVLYYYFKDKETLIRAAFHEGTRHFRELDALVLLERAVTAPLALGVVDEEVLSAVVGGDEAKTLVAVEPFHSALWHLLTSFIQMRVYLKQPREKANISRLFRRTEL